MQENENNQTISSLMNQPSPPTGESTLIDPIQKREMDIEKKKKRFKIFITILKILIIVALIVAGINYYKFRKNKVAPPAFTVDQNQVNIVKENPNTSVDTTTWTLYRNPKVRVFIRRPNDTTVLETDTPALKVDVIYDKFNLHPASTLEKDLREGYIFRVTPLDVGIRKIDDITQVKIQSFKLNCPTTATFSTPQKTLIDGIEARTFEILNCNGDYSVSYLPKFGLYFEVVQFYKGDFGYKQKYRAILKEILRAFKLFPENVAPIGPLKTFTDDINRFSFKHPNLDETCCDPPAPPIKDVLTIVQLGDKTTYIDNNNFDGVGVYVAGNSYRSGGGFNNTVEEQKRLLKEDYKVVKGVDAITQDGPIKVGSLNGVILKGYAWRGNDLIYVEIPSQNYPKLVIFSVKNLTGDEFQKKVTDILSSFKTF